MKLGIHGIYAIIWNLSNVRHKKDMYFKGNTFKDKSVHIEIK